MFYLIFYLSFGIITAFSLKEDFKNYLGINNLSWGHKLGILVGSIIMWPLLFLASVVYIVSSIICAIFDVLKLLFEKFLQK